MTQMIKRSHLFLALLLVSVIPLAGGSTGKIKGNIIDNEGQQSLIGVNIYLDGTAIGTASDELGNYLIINVPAATYTVVVSYVGYQTIRMNEVVINADRTTTLDFRLNIAAVEGEEVVVEAKRPIIVKDQTATTTTVESATINNMPVNNITDVLSTMAGVLEQHGGNYIVGGGYHFRGGRAGEITYLVDGFVVEDALYGDMGLDISRNAISEISMITGAFNAEYGEATSGVINIVTKEGKADYSWNLRGVSDALLNSSYRAQGLSRLEGTFSGPLLPSKPNLATVFFNGDILNTRTSMWKNKLPWDILKQDVDGDGVYDESDGDIIAVADISADGEENPVPLVKGAVETNKTFTDQLRYNGKLVFRPLPKLKIVASVNNFYSTGKGFSMDYRLIPEMNSTGQDQTRDFQLKSSYAVSENMYFDIKYHRYSRQQWNGYKPYLNSKHELYSKIFTIPDDWQGYVPGSLSGGDEYLWLSYYAEPFKDLNGDGVWSQYAAEFWDDSDGNGMWDDGEYFSDWNNDGMWNMIDLDGDGLPDEEPYGDMDGDNRYSFGVDPPSTSEVSYDGTSSYEFWGDYLIYNNFGDTVRTARSTSQDYWWYHSDYTTIGATLTWQYNDLHQLKSGIETRQYDIGEFWASGIGGGFFGNSSDASFIMWNHRPRSSSWYIQDKIEYSDIVINLGIRYDRLDPNSTYPDPTKELGYQYTDALGISQTITPSSLNLLSEEEKETLAWGYIQRNENGDMSGFMDAPRAPVKDQWSPRLGVGYPITDRTAFHFSYGQFYQFPDLVNMYNYSNYQGEGISPPGWSDEANDLAKDFLYGNPYYPFPYNITDWYIPEVGTPNVKPQRSVQYETGLRTRIGNQYLLTANLYYKDMFDYIASKRYDADPSQYAIYENMDYANSRGLEITLKKLFSNGFDWDLNYTLARAEGNAPTPDYHWYVAEWASGYDWRDFNRTYTMPWDQTHTINFRLNYFTPTGFGLSSIANYGSGLPYTPEDARARPIDEQYSGRMPSTSNVNLKLFYDRKMMGYDIRFFADITNLFDKENVLAVDNTTGEPDATLDSGQSPMVVWKPYYISAPRHIELGISISR